MRAKFLVRALVWLVTISTPAAAQTISLAVEDQGVYVRSFDVEVGEQFAVVTLIDTAGHDIAYAEWVQTALTVQFPGVFLLERQQPLCPCGCELLLSLDPCGGPGEFHLDSWECVAPSEDLVVARNRYLDVAGVIPSDAVLEVRGFEPGDSIPSGFNGSPGFFDCDYASYPMVLSGGDAWETGSGVFVPSGALVLNPTPPLVVGAEGQPMTSLKERYR